MLGKRISKKRKSNRLTVVENIKTPMAVKRLKAGIMAGVMAVSLVTIPAVSRNAYAANGTASELVSLAASQVGYHEKASNANLDDFYANSGSNNYNKYARDIGVTNGCAWCATFVWWLMRSAGVPDSAYPSRTTVTRDWFNQRGLYRARGTYIPNPGDYVIFGNVAHCGIVESVSGGNITTIEGNSGDQVKRNKYAISNSYILGYGIIKYNGASGGGTSTNASQTDNPGSPYPIPSGNLRSGSRGDSVKWVQKFANDVMGAGIAEDGIYGNQTIYAVRVFQQNHGLSNDGICGPQTINAMLSIWRNKVKEQDQAKHNPVGVLDLAESTKDGKLHVWGWMYDPDAVTRSNVVHVYIGGPAGTAGAESYAITANSSRKDVDNVYHVGEFHGFDAVIATKKTGNQEVYVYGINEGAGTANPVIGHKTVNLPASAHNPKFEIEEMYVTENGKLRIKGWAYDPDDVTRSIDYHVYIGGDRTTASTSEKKAYTADKTRKDIADKYNVGKNHGIDIEIETDREGSQPVYLYAINIGTGTTNPEMKKATLVFPEKWTVCEHEFTEYVSNNDATCGKDGTKTAVCNKCHVIKDIVVDENSATGNHTWDEGTVIRESTYDECGLMKYRCKDCGEVKYEEIPVLERPNENNEEELTTRETTEQVDDQISGQTVDRVTEKTIDLANDNTDKSDVDNVEKVKTSEESNIQQPASDDLSNSNNIAAPEDDTELVWSEDEFDIGSPEVTKLSNIKKKTMKLRISRVSGADGYEYVVAKVNNSTYKKFKKAVLNSDEAGISFKGVKKYTSKSTTVKLSGLKKNKRYAVAVRAYKVVGGEKYYSDYSAVKCIKIKR